MHICLLMSILFTLLPQWAWSEDYSKATTKDLAELIVTKGGAPLAAGEELFKRAVGPTDTEAGILWSKRVQPFLKKSIAEGWAKVWMSRYYYYAAMALKSDPGKADQSKKMADLSLSFSLNVPQDLTASVSYSNGILYLKVFGDFESADRCFSTIDHPFAFYYRGVIAESQNNFSNALGFYSKAATANDEDGCAALAHLYRDGLGTAKDPEKALEWYEKAYKLGRNDVHQQVEELKPLVEEILHKRAEDALAARHQAAYNFMLWIMALVGLGILLVAASRGRNELQAPSENPSFQLAYLLVPPAAIWSAMAVAGSFGVAYFQQPWISTGAWITLVYRPLVMRDLHSPRSVKAGPLMRQISWLLWSISAALTVTCYAGLETDLVWSEWLSVAVLIGASGWMGELAAQALRSVPLSNKLFWLVVVAMPFLSQGLRSIFILLAVGTTALLQAWVWSWWPASFAYKGAPMPPLAAILKKLGDIRQARRQLIEERRAQKAQAESARIRDLEMASANEALEVPLVTAEGAVITNAATARTVQKWSRLAFAAGSLTFIWSLTHLFYSVFISSNGSLSFSALFNRLIFICLLSLGISLSLFLWGYVQIPQDDRA